MTYNMAGVRDMINDISVRDIVGPVMIGPSSSHTAGACRLGYAARRILAEEPVKVVFHLYGSFRYTAQGHGTDRALVGGILGMLPDDERIKDSIALAQAAGLDFAFVSEEELPDHPNTVRFEIIGESGAAKMIEGQSVGGGNIVITKIDNTSLRFSGKNDTLVTRFIDRVGLVQDVSGVLAGFGLNILQMSFYSEGVYEEAYMIIEVDEKISSECLEAVLTVKGMTFGVAIEKLY